MGVSPFSQGQEQNRKENQHLKITAPFCQSRINVAVRQSKSLEDLEIGKQFTIVPALNVRSQVLSIKGSQKRRGKTRVQTCSIWETDSCLILLLLICVFLAFLMTHCNKSSLKRSHFVRELLYREIFSLHTPSVTVDCADCYRYNHDRFCAPNSF